MATIGTLGTLTTCPRCKSRNAVVQTEDTWGSSHSCLFCGWYGYADETPGLDGRRRGATGRRMEASPGETESLALTS